MQTSELDLQGVQGALGGGSASCNTTPPNHTPGQPKAGDDWLTVGLGIDWTDFPSLSERLAELRTEAEALGQPVSVSEGEFRFYVEAGGKRGGLGYYAYRLKWGAIRIFVKDAETHEGADNVRVEFSGLPLMVAGGVENAFFDLCRFLEALGGRVAWDKVSRYDMACDLPYVGMEPFGEAFVQGRIVTRARKFRLYGTLPRIETIGLGTGEIQARIYDKIAETEHDETKRQLMRETRWGGVVPSRAARVEFQLRREALKGFGVDSIGDLIEKRGPIARNMCELWFRITETTPDRRNPQRAKISPLWDMVRRGFDEAFSSEFIAERRHKVAPVVRKKFVEQMIGLAARYFAEANPGEVIDSATECLIRVVSDSYRLVDAEQFCRAMDRARRKAEESGHRVRGPVRRFLDHETGRPAEPVYAHETDGV